MRIAWGCLLSNAPRLCRMPQWKVTQLAYCCSLGLGMCRRFGNGKGRRDFSASGLIVGAKRRVSINGNTPFL